MPPSNSSASSRSSSESSSHNSLEEKSRSRSKSNSSSQRRKRKTFENLRRQQRPRLPRENLKGQYHKNPKDRQRRPAALEFPPLDQPLMEVDQFVQNYKAKEIPEDKLKKIYFTYKKQWESKQKDEAFCQHKEDMSTQDKYNPESRYRTQQERNRLAKIHFDDFVAKYNLGQFNSINLTVNLEELQDLVQNQDKLHYDKRDLPFYEFLLKENTSIDISEEPFFIQDPNLNTLYIKTVPPTISKWTIWDVVSVLPGFLNLSVSGPVKANDGQRMAWIGFESESSLSSVLSITGGVLKVKNVTLQLQKQSERKKLIRVSTCIDHNKLYKDYEIQRELIEKLDSEKNLKGNPLTSGPHRDRDDPGILRYLDVQTLYLRRVHSYCYWSAGEFVDERVLNQKCGSAFLRLLIDLPRETTTNWQETVQTMAQKRIEMSNQGLIIINSFQETIEKAIEKTLKPKIQKVKNENMEIFPCEHCTKSFKGSDYLIRHMSNKHQTQYDQIADGLKQKIIESQMLETYKQEKSSKVNLQKIIFGGQGFGEDFIFNKRIFIPINFAPRPQSRIYKDLDNMIQIEKTIPQNIVLPVKTTAATINYNDI